MTKRPHPGSDRPLAGPLLLFGLAEEVSRLKSEPDWMAGKRTITLTKQGGLRVVLIALHAGATMDDHHAAGALTAQVLEGHVRFIVGDETHELRPGGLVALEPGLPHQVRALEESVFLLTLAQPADR